MNSRTTETIKRAAAAALEHGVYGPPGKQRECAYSFLAGVRATFSEIGRDGIALQDGLRRAGEDALAGRGAFYNLK